MGPRLVILFLREELDKETLYHLTFSLLGAEVLSRMLILAENIGAFQYVGVAKDAPNISHLFFVYDIFIFVESIQAWLGKLRTS